MIETVNAVIMNKMNEKKEKTEKEKGRIRVTGISSPPYLNCECPH